MTTPPTDGVQMNEQQMREMDRRIAVEVMGWRWETSPDTFAGGEAWVADRPAGVLGMPAGRWEVAREDWSPTRDIAAAWSVVQKMDKHWFDITYSEYADAGMEHERATVSIFDLGQTTVKARCTNASLPIAICRAALASLSPKEPK